MDKKKLLSKWLDNRSLFQSVLIGFILIVAIGVIVFVVLQGASPESTTGDLLRYTSIALGVLALGGTAVVQYRKQKDSEERVVLERDMQFAERLTKAVEHLGSDSRAIRNGGLHELRRLANDSEKDRIPALEIIAQFITHLQWRYDIQNPQEQKKFESELRSAKDVFGAFLRQLEPGLLYGTDFNGADFSNMNLQDADLSGVDFRKANLSGADLRETSLSGANLMEANLSEASLWGTNLNGTNLMMADLSEAWFFIANLSGACLWRANLSGAALRYAKLIKANFSEANLSGADFREAKLSGTNFSGAGLEEADFRGVDLREVDMSVADFSKANLEGAILPD